MCCPDPLENGFRWAVFTSLWAQDLSGIQVACVRIESCESEGGGEGGCGGRASGLVGDKDKERNQAENGEKREKTICLLLLGVLINFDGLKF